MTSEEAAMEWFRQTDLYFKVRTAKSMSNREMCKDMEDAFEDGLHRGYRISTERLCRLVSMDEPFKE